MATGCAHAARSVMRPAPVALAMAVLLLGACASAPLEPGVLALPGTGKTLEQFNADDGECRQHANARQAGTSGASWSEQQRRYDYAYIQCMYVKGHKVPIPGQFTSAPPGGPPPPQGKPEPATK